MYSGGIYVREIGSINHEALSIRKQVATHHIVILCRQHQMETCALGQWHLSITFFSKQPNRWPSGNPSSPEENTTLAAATSADRDKLNIKAQTPGRLLIVYFS